MTTAATTPKESRSRTASAIILGADAVLAAHPATAVQLAHACLRVGYSTVIPASWGDELLAGETIRQLQGKAERPYVFCACPHVSARLLGVGDDLAPFLIPLVAPPVAVALHLRELAHGEPIEIAFVGTCPAGADAAIDAQFAPADFLAMLAHRGIALLEQPEVFDSVLPPDRRRHRSLPGGVPTAEALWSEGAKRALIEIADPEPLTELAQHLASGDAALLDLGPALSCACSGAVPGVPARSARSALCALEPPRSRSEIIEPSPYVQLSRPLTMTAARSAAPPLPPAVTPALLTATDFRQKTQAHPDDADASDRDPSDGSDDEARLETQSVADSTATPHFPDTSVSTASSSESLARRRSTTVAARAAAGSLPVTSSGEGRALPRAYIARRPVRRRPPADDRARAAAAAPPAEQSEPVPGTSGSGSAARIFAPVPIAAPRSVAHGTGESTPEATVALAPAPGVRSTPASLAAAAPASPQPATGTQSSGQISTPVVVLREHARRFARQSAERPAYLGVLLAIVAVLSIALGVAAGRALRGATPLTADPVEHGAGADSLLGTSSAIPGSEDGEAEASDRSSLQSPPGTSASDPGARRSAPPASLRQSAAGNVAPTAPTTLRSTTRDTRTSGQAATGNEPAARAAARRDSIAADSASRAMAADSVRRDSVARDSAQQAAATRDSSGRATRDSLPLIRPSGAPMPGDSLLQREREELREALADRQRRIDSLQRWLDSARRTTPPPAPPAPPAPPLR